MIINNHQKVAKIWLDSKAGIYNYALKQTKDKEIANEITQEVLMKIYKACFKNTEVQNTRSWLFQIAHNAIIDYQKQQQKIKTTKLVPIAVDDQTIWSDLAILLEPILNFLPPKYAIPLKMHAIEGLKQAEIAKKLNLGLSATKSRIQRAKNLLKAEIETCCHLETRADGQVLDFRIKDNCKPLQEFRKHHLNDCS